MAVFKQYTHEDYQLYHEIQHQNNMESAFYYYITGASDFGNLLFSWSLLEGIEDEEFVVKVLDTLATEFEDNESVEYDEFSLWETVIEDYVQEHSKDHERFVKMIYNNLVETIYDNFKTRENN